MSEAVASDLRAVVVGAGWAGEGHTVALQHAGVTVEAICARDPGAVATMARRLGVPHPSTDWRASITSFRPDIVAVATPAALRREVIELAAELGCHVFCDKPLATSADEAQRLYHVVERAGVKHAYGATHRYGPDVRWLAELVRGTSIGTLRTVVATSRLDYARLVPWSWNCLVATGGGALHQGLPHYLGMFEEIVGGPAVKVTGEARVLVDRAPVLPPAYGEDGRKAKGSLLAGMTDAERARLEWRECDAENACTALMRFKGPASEVHVTLSLGRGVQVPGEPNRMCLYGDHGTLLAEGSLFAFEVSRTTDGKTLEALPIPQRLLDELPAVGDSVQNKWCRLALDFAADVRGKPFRPYPTFRDGWRYQVAIDAIREGAWCALPAAEPAEPVAA